MPVRYEILATIGGGGMGLALDQTTLTGDWPIQQFNRSVNLTGNAHSVLIVIFANGFTGAERRLYVKVNHAKQLKVCGDESQPLVNSNSSELDRSILSFSLRRRAAPKFQELFSASKN